MEYFTKEFNDFFKDLSKNNNTEWFHANKKRYEEFVKEPFEEFVAEMISKMQKEDSEINILPKDAIFRINRDLRFSKDKKPYKEWVSAVISKFGKRDKSYPGIYFHIGTKGLMLGGGMHRMEKEDLDKVRRHIQKNSAEFTRLIEDKEFKKVFGDLKGDRNKVLPEEYKKDAEKQPYLANKEFYFIAEYKDPKVILRDDLAEFMMSHYKSGKDLSNFLKKAVS